MNSANLAVSTVFMENMQNIVDSRESMSYVISCKFKIDNTIEVDIPPFDLKELSILQDFYNNYRDVINLKVDLNDKEFNLVKKNRQGVRVSISYFEHVPESQPVLVVTKKYLAILKDQEDNSLTEASGNVVEEEEDGDATNQRTVDFELIDPLIYAARKKETNFILNNVTVEETLLFLAKLFGFKKVHITTPDNETRYTNMVIPPVKGLEEILDYLQGYAAYGVYSDGINHYIQDSILYIFPLCRNNPDGFKFNVYNAGDSVLAGADNYHRLNGPGGKEGIDIVLSSKVEVVSMSQAAVENIGNAYIVNTPKKHFEGSGAVIADDTYDIPDDFLTNIVGIDTVSGASKDAYRQNYVVTDNLFNLYSDLSAVETVKIRCNWQHAYPFVITPTVSVGYCVDVNGIITRHPGWCDVIAYTFARANSVAGKTFDCNVSLCLSIKKIP